MSESASENALTAFLALVCAIAVVLFFLIPENDSEVCRKSSIESAGFLKCYNSNDCLLTPEERHQMFLARKAATIACARQDARDMWRAYDKQRTEKEQGRSDTEEKDGGNHGST